MHPICQDRLRLGRPDRGPEEPCQYPARWRVDSGGWASAFVCGYHARAYAPLALDESLSGEGGAMNETGVLVLIESPRGIRRRLQWVPEHGLIPLALDDVVTVLQPGQVVPAPQVDDRVILTSDMPMSEAREVGQIERVDKESRWDNRIVLTITLPPGDRPVMALGDRVWVGR